ncbi:O-antigen polymerase [Acinetobacter johnsonii]|uniref:O-antigen polymerase n=1 Tax=Acinetobacter johnsonii TaxID=40214 RepID=UPI002D7FCE50|nr:O-antigen polymerase [Acinetobacter johnsonii]
MSKYILNPFFYYIFIFLFILFLYLLRWSYLQPLLTFNLVIFFFVTFLISALGSIVFQNFFHNDIFLSNSGSNKFVIFFIFLGAVAELGYQGAIPLIEILKGANYDYTGFGIPTFHVFFLPYISAVGVLSFYGYLVEKNKSKLYIFLFSILFSILIVNRGALIFSFISSILIYLKYKGGISLKKICFTSIAMLVVLYLFGVIGNYRMVSSGYQSQDVIISLGQATPEFYNSSVPNEFFWSYLYIVTPLANLQHQVNNIPVNTDYIDVIKYHLLIDFLQKRIFPDEEKKLYLIADEFNVSTMYGEIVQKSGFIGLYIIFFWFLICIFLIAIITPLKYRSPVFALLCSIAILTCFTNVITFSGFILQPILLSILGHFRIGRYNLI